MQCVGVSGKGAKAEHDALRLCLAPSGSSPTRAASLLTSGCVSSSCDKRLLAGAPRGGSRSPPDGGAGLGRAGSTARGSKAGLADSCAREQTAEERWERGSECSGCGYGDLQRSRYRAGDEGTRPGGDLR